MSEALNRLRDAQDAYADALEAFGPVVRHLQQTAATEAATAPADYLGDRCEGSASATDCPPPTPFEAG